MENKNYSGRNGEKAGKRFFPCKIFLLYSREAFGYSEK